MTTSPEAWSAIAAFFSAFVALLMLRIESRSLRNSARPELIISGWSRSSVSDMERITFTELHNVGIGSALHLIGNAFSVADDDRAMASMPTLSHMIIPPNGKVSENGEIHVWWKNVSGTPGRKCLPITINLLCWDTTGARYLTSYKLLAVELSNPIYMQDQIAPGILLSSRIVKIEAVWVLKLIRFFSKLPLIKRFIKDKSVPA